MTEQLTRENILAMKPGRELDALVAEKVMGWTKRFNRFSGANDWIGKGAGMTRNDRNFQPSTDIAAAWEVVEKFEYIDVRRFKDHYGCTVYGKTVTGKTAPEAICKAILIAFMEV